MKTLKGLVGHVLKSQLALCLYMLEKQLGAVVFLACFFGILLTACYYL